MQCQMHKYNAVHFIGLWATPTEALDLPITIACMAAAQVFDPAGERSGRWAAAIQ